MREKSTTVMIDKEGRLTIPDAVREDLDIDGGKTSVEIDITAPDTGDVRTTTVPTDERGRVTVPKIIRDVLGITGEKTVTEVTVRTFND